MFIIFRNNWIQQSVIPSVLETFKRMDLKRNRFDLLDGGKHNKGNNGSYSVSELMKNCDENQCDNQPDDMDINNGDGFTTVTSKRKRINKYWRYKFTKHHGQRV